MLNFSPVLRRTAVIVETNPPRPGMGYSPFPTTPVRLRASVQIRYRASPRLDLHRIPYQPRTHAAKPPVFRALEFHPDTYSSSS